MFKFVGLLTPLFAFRKPPVATGHLLQLPCRWDPHRKTRGDHTVLHSFHQAPGNKIYRKLYDMFLIILYMLQQL